MFKIKQVLMSGGGMGGGGMGNGGGNNGGGGGMGGSACYTYTKPTDTALLEKLQTETNQISFNREVYMGGSMTMDDGTSVNIWGFNGNDVGIIGPNIAADNGGNGGMGGGMNGGGPFPSPAMRVTQGQLVHTNLTVNMMLKHTIHHHGIEPDFRSDGVGHTSWDVTGNHTYQWRPSSAGTYFYHCHTNTVLHAEMGMYGALIVDPPVDPADPIGTKRAFEGGQKYDVEAIWVVDEIDNNWHNLAGSGNSANWTAGLCGENTGKLQLNELNPDYFIITGVDAAGVSASVDSSAMKTASGIPATVQVGQTLLIRYINAGFLPQLADFAGLNVEIIASDGHGFRNADGTPKPVAMPGSKLETVSAERYDILYTATAADKLKNGGEHVIKFNIKDSVTDKVLGIARTKVIII
ncbi:MAG: multicopper oxidase domain-containing protein [Thiohalomonadales bacterium]